LSLNARGKGAYATGKLAQDEQSLSFDSATLFAALFAFLLNF
jgi:hypothetical protein